MVQPRAGQGAVQIALRLSPELRDAIRAVADKNGRSMNSEIVRRLEESLLVESLPDDDYAPTENIHPDTSPEDLVALLSQALEIARRGV